MSSLSWDRNDYHQVSTLLQSLGNMLQLLLVSKQYFEPPWVARQLEANLTHADLQPENHRLSHIPSQTAELESCLCASL